MTAFRIMLRAIDDCYAELLETGTQAGMIDRMRTRAELYERIDYAEYDARDQDWCELPSRTG
jgi:methylisocitrate lyase